MEIKLKLVGYQIYRNKFINELISKYLINSNHFP